MMLTCKVANEKRDHALTFTFELAASLPQSSPSQFFARVCLSSRQSRRFCGNDFSCHTAPFDNGGCHVTVLLREGSPEGTPGNTASNITSHPTTGIGAWTDQEIARAITEGVGRDGRLLRPPMAYAYYAGLKEADLADIIVYLRKVPPLQ